MHYYFLSVRERQLIVALAPFLLPEAPAYPRAFERKMLFHVDRHLARLPIGLRTVFHLGTRLFDTAPVWRFFRTARFANTTPDIQSRAVQFAATSQFPPLYRWLHTVRGLLLFIWYSQDKTHPELDYSPRQWAKSRIIERRRQLTKERLHDSHSPRYPR